MSTMFAVIILVAAACMDCRRGKIPNRWILIGICGGLLFLITDFSVGRLGSCLVGMALPMLICWIPFRMGALGAGDVKLFLFLGCLLGGFDVIYCIFFAFLYAAGISLSRLLSRGQLKGSIVHCIQYFYEVCTTGRIKAYPGNGEEGHRIHVAPAILFGYLTLLGVKVCKNLPLFLAG